MRLLRARLAILVSIAGLGPFVCPAADLKGVADAASLYHAHHYQEALEVWKEVAKSDPGAAVYYNIGLAEAHLDHVAQSIYALELASCLRPLNRDIEGALQAERKKINNASIPLPSFFLVRWYLGWITFLRPGWWALMSLLFFLVAMVFWLKRLKVIPFLFPGSNRWIVALSIIGFVLLISSLLAYRHLYNQKEGVVMQPCDLRQAAAAESPLLRALDAGEHITIKDHIGEWYYVALLNQDYGWIRMDCCKRLSFHADL